MGYVDIHSHILPYMDDGSPNVSVTMEMLQIAWREGITDIIVTPHYKSGRFKGDRRQMLEIMDDMKLEMEKCGLSINLYPGNEIYYRSGLESRLEAGRLSTMNDTEYILVEFSPMEDFLYIRNAMEDIFGMGYTPIIAHVERYECMVRHPEYVRELKNMGCEIQVNAASIVGEVGFKIKRFTRRLIAERLVDYIGTDAHNTGKRKPTMKKCADILYKRYEKSYVDTLLFGNATKRLLCK